VPVERRTDALEATEELAGVLLRTSLSLQDIYVSMLEEVPANAFPGENPAEVLLEMISGSATLAIEAAGLELSRAATALIGAVMDRVLDDLRAAAALARTEGRC
jgi:23S rRNA G2445 N2-methylase RlmL